MIELPQDSPVIDEARHRRLLEDVDRYAALAGIRKEWIWQPLSEHVPEMVSAWVRGVVAREMAEKDRWGLILTGTYSAAPRVLEATCGALVRCFVDARLRRCTEVLEDESAAECSCLLLGDFGLAKLPEGKRSALAGILLDRYHLGLQTVVYVGKQGDVAEVYGPQISELLKSRYYKAEL